MDLIKKYQVNGKLTRETLHRLSKNQLIVLLNMIDAIQQSIKDQIKQAKIRESKHGIPIDKAWLKEVKKSRAKRFEHRKLAEAELGVKKINQARKNKRRNGGYGKLLAA